jgi:hypothetical protein
MPPNSELQSYFPDTDFSRTEDIFSLLFLLLNIGTDVSPSPINEREGGPKHNRKRRKGSPRNPKTQLPHMQPHWAAIFILMIGTFAKKTPA